MPAFDTAALDPLSGRGESFCLARLSASALRSLSESCAEELCSALIEAGQSDQAWEALRLSGREELLAPIAQKACSSRQISCARFADLGGKAALWAVESLGGSDVTRLGLALSEILVVRNAAFLARAQEAAGVGLLESLARSGAMFPNGMTLSNARRLSWAFDALDERFERACLERDLGGPRMLLAGSSAQEAPRRQAAVEAATAALTTLPGGQGMERRRMGGFGLLGLATGRREPFKRALDLLSEMGFDLGEELSKRTAYRNYGGMDFPPHNCMTAALVSRNEANARLVMEAAPEMSPEEEMRKLIELMGEPAPFADQSERERQRSDFAQAKALACSLEIERSTRGGRGGFGESARSRSKAL